MVQKHREAAFKLDTSGCPDLEARRLPGSLVSGVECGRNALT